MYNYKSPIEAIVISLHKQYEIDIEKGILTAVYNAGISVDKEELGKALKYDRDQYNQGYRDAKSEIVRCEECALWKESGYIHPATGICEKYLTIKKNYGFCDEGERKCL